MEWDTDVFSDNKIDKVRQGIWSRVLPLAGHEVVSEEIALMIRMEDEDSNIDRREDLFGMRLSEL